jgi:hypothetical protein
MSGLSYFDNGGQVEADQTQVMVKPTSGRGRYGLPTPTTNIPASTGVLSAMEQVYMDKLAQQSGFMEAMKDAAAWWSGGVEGPSAGLSRRGKEREEQAANLFQLQTQIAQFKAAQEDQAKFEREKPALLGQSSSLSGMDLQPHEIDLLSRTRTRAEFNDLLGKFGMERTKGLSQPGAAEAKYPVFILDDEGNPVYDEVPLAVRNQLVRSGKGFLPGSELPAPKPAAPPAAAPPAAAPPAAAPPAAAPPAAAPPAAAPPAAAPPAAAPLPAPTYTFSELSPDQINAMRQTGRDMGLTQDVVDRPDAAELFDKQPMEKRKKIFEALSKTPTQLAAAPSGTMTDVTAPTTGRATQPTQLAQAMAPAAPPAAPRRVPTVVSARAEQEAEKLERAEDIKVVAKEYENFRSDIKSAPVKETTASEAIKLLTQDKTIAGFFQKPGIGAALGTLIKSGISAPGGHSIGIKELDEVLFKGQKDVTTEQIRARDRLRTLLNTNSLMAASIMKGQGAVTEFERQLLERMVGSLDSTPENLVKIQQMLQARAQLDMRTGEDFRKSGLTYNKYTRSNEYVNALRDYQIKIKQIEDSDVRTPLSQSQKPSQGQGTTSGGVRWREVR